jgi:hypothetical protein
MKEMQKWLKENLTEVWAEEVWLAWLQNFLLFCVWRV